MKRFLLAQIYIDSLDDKPTPNSVLKALQGFQQQRTKSWGNVLHNAYDQVMERVKGQKMGRRELATQTLAWITCAERPLSIFELQHALAVDQDSEVHDEDNVPLAGDIVAVCAGLVTIGEESGIIRLVHYTTQDYLQGTIGMWFPDAERYIAESCIRYLSYHTFDREFCSTMRENIERLLAYPLFKYAALNWGHHARKSSTSPLLVDFLVSDSRINASCQGFIIRCILYYPHDWDEGNIILWLSLILSGGRHKLSLGLHIAAFFGLPELVVDLLQKGYAPDVRDLEGQTPLWYAVRNGHEAVVKLLLAAGADPKSEDPKDVPLLFIATLNGHEVLVKLLLSVEGVHLHSKNWVQAYASVDDCTRALDVAGENTSRSPESYTMIPLVFAARRDKSDEVESSSIESMAKMLFYAIVHGRTQDFLVEVMDRCHQRVTQLILQSRREFDLENREVILSQAASRGREEIAELVLAMGGIDINARDSRSRTALSKAAEQNHEGVVKLLLAKDADPNTRGYGGATPLISAAKYGNTKMVQMLLAVDSIDLGATDDYGRTALLVAAEEGHLPLSDCY